MPVKSLEDLVSKWVELRSRIASEKIDWKNSRENLVREISLLEKEKAGLEKQIAEAGDFAESIEKERAGLLAKHETLKNIEKNLKPVLDKAESAALKWKGKIPASLAGETGRLPADIPETHEETERLTISQRMQGIIAFYTQLENLQHNIHLVRELVPSPEGRRELDVLYLGLAAGYAVSSDNSWSALGTPGKDGWTWVPAPELAGRIRKAVDVFNRQSPAQLVRLPLKTANTFQEDNSAEKPEE